MPSDAVKLSLEQPVQLSPSDKRVVESHAAYFFDGNYVAIWNQFDSTSASWKVTGRLFDNNDVPIGQQFFTSSPALRLERTDVEIYSNNKFIIAWSSLFREKDDWKISIQTFQYTPADSSSSSSTDQTPVAIGVVKTISSSSKNHGQYDIATLSLDNQYIIAYMQDEFTLKYEKYSIDNTQVVDFVSTPIALKRSYGTEIKVNAVPTQYYFVLTYYSQLNDRFIIIRKYNINDGSFIPGSEKSILTIPLELYTALSYSGNFVVGWRDIKVTCDNNQNPLYKAIMYSSDGTILIPQSTINNSANTKLHQVFALSSKYMMASFISGDTFSAKIYDFTGEISTTVGPNSVSLTTSSTSSESKKQQAGHRMLLQSGSDSDSDALPRNKQRTEPAPTTSRTPSPGSQAASTPVTTNVDDCGQLHGITVCNYDDIVLSKLFSFLDLMNNRVFKDYQLLRPERTNFFLDNVNFNLFSQVFHIGDLYNYRNDDINHNINKMKSLLYTFKEEDLIGLTNIEYTSSTGNKLLISGSTLDLPQDSLQSSPLSINSQVGIFGKSMMHYIFTYIQNNYPLPSQTKFYGTGNFLGEDITISNSVESFDTCYQNKDTRSSTNIFCFSYFFQAIDKILRLQSPFKVTIPNSLLKPTIRLMGYTEDNANVQNIPVLVQRLLTVLYTIKDKDSFSLTHLQNKYNAAYTNYCFYISSTPQDTWPKAQDLFSDMYEIIKSGKLRYINGDGFSHCLSKYAPTEEDTDAFTWRPAPAYPDIHQFPTVICVEITNNQESFNTLSHELSHNAGTKDKFPLVGVNEVYIDSKLCSQWSKKFGKTLQSNEDFAAYCIGDFLSLFYQSDF